MASARVAVVSGLLVVCSAVAANSHDAFAAASEADSSGFPKLFEMEDYEACARSGGEYCVGDFELSSADLSGAELSGAELSEAELSGVTLNNVGEALLQRLKEHSADPLNFNRTVIHRAACAGGPAAAAAAHFARAVAAWAARALRLRAEPARPPLCRRGPDAPDAPDGWDRAALAVAAVVLAANVFGTVYDCVRDQTKDGIGLALAWSVRVNWRRLTANYPEDTPLGALKPLQGVKVIGLLIVITAHVAFLHHQGFIQNPDFLEKVNHEPLMVVVFNGSSIVQVFVVTSSFLFAYSLLLLRSARPALPLGAGTFVKCLMYRWARIAPLYLFMVGFAATWWRRAGSGPLWPALVAAEGAVCRQQFWRHALFLQNVVEPDERCLVHTWYLAAEMQLVWPVTALTLALVARPARARPVLAGLLAGSVALNAALAYRFGLKSILFYAGSESVRHLFSGDPSFTWMYTSAWGSLPCALLGLLLAFMLHQHKGGISEKCLRRCEVCGLALLCAVVLGGHWARRLRAPGWLALHAALERPAYCAAAALAVAPSVLRGRGWLAHPVLQVLGRLALPVYLVHWLVCVGYVALPPTPVYNGLLTLWSATAGTAALSVLLAVPLHLLVEAPAQRALQCLLLGTAGAQGAQGARVAPGGERVDGGEKTE